MSSHIPPEQDRRQKKPRRQEDLTLEEQIEELEGRLRNFFIKALIAFAIIGVAVAVALAGFGIVLNRQSSFTDDIQTQRYDSLVKTCQDQNNRHNRAIESASQFPPTTFKIVVLLVSQIAPFEPDCEGEAAKRVKN